MRAGSGSAVEPDSVYAWWRLAASLVLSTIGGVGLWSVVVSLPAIEAEFGVDRGGAPPAAPPPTQVGGHRGGGMGGAGGRL
jgi:hypothetical protein